MDPSEFGMRSRKNNKPVLAWTFLVTLLASNGMLRLTGGLSGSLRQRKRVLSRHLQATFGLADDPIRWVEAEQSYFTSFVAADDRSKADKEQWRRELANRRRR
jgi:hypothetical protein